MNDAASSDGSGGSGGASDPPNACLEERAKELQKVATERTLEVANGGKRFVDFAADGTEARAKAKEYIGEGSGSWIDTREDGRVEVTYGGLTSAPNGVEPGEVQMIWFPRTSKAWKDVYDSYDTTIENLLSTGKYKDDDLTQGILNMGAVIRRLDQGTQLEDKAQEVVEGSMATLKGDDKVSGVDLGSFLGSESPWAITTPIQEALAAWTGRAAEMFRLVYINRLPAILVGQMMIAKVLKETLEIAQTAFRGARKDGEKLAQEAIDVLETGGHGDINWTKTLKTVEEVAAMAKAGGDTVATFIPHPAVTGFAKAANYVSQGAGLAASVASKVEDQKDPTYELESYPPEKAMDSVSKHADKIHDAVDSIESACAKILDEFLEFVTSNSQSGVRVWPARSDSGNAVELTVRQAFFEPKAPGEEKGYGPGLGDDFPEDGSGYDQLRDPDVLGAPPVHGDSLAANLEDLWHVGHDWLPDLAGQYSDIQTFVTLAEQDVKVGFTHPLGGTGSLYPKWKSLHEEYFNIVKNSATNLNDVGDTVEFAAQAYAEQDTAASKELEDRMDGLPWE